MQEVVSAASLTLWFIQTAVGSPVMIYISLKSILKTYMQVVPRCLAGICCSSQLSFNNTNYDVGLGNDDPELELIPFRSKSQYYI